MCGAIVFDVAWAARQDAAGRRRVFAMVAVMAVFGGAWTMGEVLGNNRWIEVGDASDGLTRAPPALEILALLWDVLTEFSLIFVPFLALPQMLGLIKSGEGDGAAPSADGVGDSPQHRQVLAEGETRRGSAMPRDF
ncbi:MAG: hypothetical protein Kow0069_39010 [Promethearchaeota archaeon]